MPDSSAASPQSLEALMPDLTRLCRRLAPSRDAADDLRQEVALRVLARLNAGGPIDDLRAYVMTVARNGNRRRPVAPDELTDAAMPSTAPEAPARLAAAEVLHALARLPHEQSVLLLEVAREGLSYQALADRHGLPLGTVMSRLSRARQTLRADLKLGKSDPTSSLIA